MARIKKTVSPRIPGIDPLTPQERSVLMSRVRLNNTTPELCVRRLLHSLGFRGYRLNVKSLPGKPDVVFKRRKVAIFVHGCFWHFHECSPHAKIPKSRIDYWREKLLKNRARDNRAVEALRAEGWSVLVIWECQTKDEGALIRTLSDFLIPDSRLGEF